MYRGAARRGVRRNAVILSDALGIYHLIYGLSLRHIVRISQEMSFG